jgi:hypothetical protein
MWSYIHSERKSSCHFCLRAADAKLSLFTNPLRCCCIRLLLKCDGTCAETRLRLSAKRTSPFKSVGASVQSTTGIQGVRISGSNAGYTMFRGSVKSTVYPHHSPVPHRFPSRASPCAITFQLDSNNCLRICLIHRSWERGLTFSSRR